LLLNSRIEYKCAVESPSARILSIDRALRAVGHVLQGLTALALVMLVRFEVGLRSTPTAFLYMIILVLPARAGGLIRAAKALVTTRLVSR
jgi:hypothetical protein